MHRISIETTVKPFPRVESVEVDVEVVARDSEKWSLSFSFREAEEGPVKGPFWDVTFYRWNVRRVANAGPFRPFEESRDQLQIPVSGYAVGATNVELRSEQSPLERFLNHARSEESFRDAALADLAELKRLVSTAIEERKVEAWEGGREVRDEFPAPSKRPMNGEERTLYFASSRYVLSERIKLVRGHYREMYSVWRESYPMERCWPELRAP